MQGKELYNSINKKNNLQDLKKQLRQLDALNKITFDLTRIIKLDILLNKIIYYATQIVEGEAASILLLDKDKKELYFKASLGKKSQEIKKYKVKIGKGIAGWVAEKGESLIVEDVRKDARWNKDFDIEIEFKTKSIICIPLILDTEIVGVMEVINKKGESSFDKDDEAILNSFANQAVIALRNANMVNDLSNYFVNIIEILIQAMESESLGPKGHFVHVARLATQIGSRLNVTEKDYKDLYYASLLHDIGKLKVKRKIDINFKDEDTVNLIQDEVSMHPIVGANMLKQINLFEGIIAIVKHHHENYDGTGYPQGLKGEEIPLASRIIAVVEEYIKLSYNKSNENIFQNEQILKKLSTFSGIKFDPKVVNALKEIV